MNRASSMRLGIGYAVAPVGADHQMNMHDTAFSRPGDNIDRVNEAQPADNQIQPQSPYEVDENKMMMFCNELNWTHFQDCAINCHFYPYGYGPHGRSAIRRDGDSIQRTGHPCSRRAGTDA
jgi:hypothetical protein